MVEITSSLPISSYEKTITECFIYPEKDKNTKELTGKKMLGIKFLAKKKNKETGYYENYEDMISMSLTDYAKLVKIGEDKEKEILSTFKGKKLVIETKISPL